MKKQLKVALAHDYLNSWGGGERVLNIFKQQLYPQADVYAITYDLTSVAGHVSYPIRTSFLQRVPFASKYHKWFLALMPAAVERMKLKDYDLVLSDSSGFIKGIVVPPTCLHVCYIHTTTRYLTVDVDYFRESVPKKLHWLMPPFLWYLKKKDLQGSKRPDIYIANSQEIAGRIKKYYHREVDAVVFPPVDTHTFYRKADDVTEEWYLVAGRLAPYKRFDLAIRACLALGRKLVVIGAGPELDSLKEIAGGSDLIEFRGKVSDADLRTAYASCRAMIFPPFEDAGMTPIETMACGRPVIAYGKGGALESVVDGKTGVFFAEQTPESLCEALEKFEKKSWDSAAIISHADAFSSQKFLEKIKKIIDEALAKRGSIV